MKRILPVMSMVSALALMPSCRYTMQQYVPAQESASADSYVSPSLMRSLSAVTRNVNSREIALNHCREQMELLAPEISLAITYGNLQTEINAICQYMLDSGVAVALETETTGNKIVMRPEYSDCMLMLRAHHNPAFLGTLSERSRQALFKAQHIVASVCSKYPNEYERAVALHDYIILNTRYESTLGIAARADATTKLLLDGRAVCDGYAHAYGMLLSMAGIENKFLIGKGDGIEHIWNLVYLDGRWTHIDITYDDPKPDKDGRVMHTYFGMSDARISSNHKWNRALYPSATTDSLFYLFRNNLRFRTVRDMLSWSKTIRRRSDWAISMYVDELENLKSETAIHDKIQDVANELRVTHLKSIAVDKGCKAAVYCVFGR